jgi:acyl-CoA reductase-like NAD-dependent aldehyde dehydrogenase
MLIGGELVDAEGDRRLDAVNPYTRDVFATIPDASSADVRAAVGAVQSAFDTTWSAVSGAERARLLHRLADLIEERASELDRLESTDNGKILRETVRRALPRATTASSPATPTSVIRVPAATPEPRADYRSLGCRRTRTSVTPWRGPQRCCQNRSR